MIMSCVGIAYLTADITRDQFFAKPFWHSNPLIGITVFGSLTRAAMTVCAAVVRSGFDNAETFFHASLHGISIC